MSRWFMSLGMVLALTLGAHAADWPQWLGPKRDGTSTEVVKPWQGKLKVLWQQQVGEGHSSPVVADGRVYLFTKQRDADVEVLTAYAADTGKPLWETTYPRPKYNDLFGFGKGPRATPLTGSGKVFTHGITGLLTCFDAVKGDKLWQIDTLKDFNGTNLTFGVSTSPLLDQEHLLVNIGAKGASIVAFQRDTGKVVWKTLDDKASYSSPMLFGANEDRQAVFMTQKGLVSVAPRDGSVYWQYPWQDALSESSATPIVTGNLLIGSSITLGSVALKLITTTAIPKAEKAWTKADWNSYFATPVVVGKHMYMVTGTAPPALKSQATLRCIDLDGVKELWKKEPVGTYHASLLRTGDNKLLMLEENGQLVLLEADPKEYRELARTRICGTTWAHPAFANQRLYIRDGKELLCVELP